MFLKNRKSRKQLLKEIEELKAEKIKYFDWWEEKSNAYISISRKIKTISATCISRYDDEGEWRIPIQESLCKELAKQMIPYITFEKYKMVGKHWDGEVKYIATINIIE